MAAEKGEEKGKLVKDDVEERGRWINTWAWEFFTESSYHFVQQNGKELNFTLRIRLILLPL